MTGLGLERKDGRRVRAVLEAAAGGAGVSEPRRKKTQQG